MEAKFHEYAPKNVNVNKAMGFLDKDFNFVSFKENFRRFLGILKEHENIFRIIDEKAGQKLKEEMPKLENGEPVYVTSQVERSDGAFRELSLRFLRLPDNHVRRNTSEYSVEMIDIVNAHDYIYGMEFNLLKYQDILQNYTNMVFEFDTESGILQVGLINLSVESVCFRKTLREFSASIPDMDASEEDKKNLNMFCAALVSGENYIEFVFDKNPFVKDDEEEQEPVILRGSTFVLSEGKAVTTGCIASYENGGQNFTRDINSFDMMTGLLNKKAVLDLARGAIDDHLYEQVFLVMLDLDNFKMVNDTYGHMMGDRVIKKIAEILRANVKQSGWVGRFGGDEYFIVLYNLGGEGDLRAILEAIAYNVENCYKDKFDGFNLSCSMGIAEYPRNGDNFDLLFKKADRGVYIAKKKGKKRYIIYKEALHGEIDMSSGDVNYAPQEITTRRFAGDIKRYEIMSDGIASLFSGDEGALDSFIARIIEGYCLDGVSIYMGEDFKLTKNWGGYTVPMDNADYMKDPRAVARFNEKGIFWENNVRYNGNYVPIIHDKLLEHNIYATVQCLIKEGETIKGIMTFDMEESIRNWTEEDTNYFGIVAKVLGNIF